MEQDYASFIFKEKRKWQIALRRYVLEKKPSAFYAPYFGLDVKTYREWIENQFDAELSWDNFSTHWQFEHIVPVAYFDFTNENDLKLCWNFTNIRVEKCHPDKTADHRLDVLAAKNYFLSLYQQTNYAFAGQMVERIAAIEQQQLAGNQHMGRFMVERKAYFDAAPSFGTYEFTQLNEGVSLEDVLAERELLKKFGS